MKIVTIADTHGFHKQVTVPAGDALIVAGDICPQGTLQDIKKFCAWLQKQPCKYKIVVAGNHDKPFELENQLARKLLTKEAPEIIYLQDNVVEIEKVKFYGSPWTPTFMNWYFMADRGAAIQKKWAAIPKDIDVLITHGPPATILDGVRGIPLGCDDLLKKVQQINPQYHVFGHIHEGYGTTIRNGTTFINASVCDGRYRPINKPVVFSLCPPPLQ